MESGHINGQPIVTVVIPSLNVAPYIRQCMDSVLNQTIANIEVFAVDAASTDGTHEILEEYAKKDARVKLFDDIKKSTGYAKNIGLEQGHGKYYAVVESDDYIEPDMFETMVHIAEELDADFVKGNYNNFIGDADEKRVFPGTTSPFPEDYEKLINPADDNHCFIWGMFEWLGIYRMDFLRKHNIRHNETKGAAYQDTGFWFLTFSYARKIYLLPRYYYNYRRDNPFSSMKSSGNVFGICNEYEYIREILKHDVTTLERTEPAWYRGFYYDNCVACSRLNPEGKKQLIKRMRETMSQGMHEGKLDKALYSYDEWEELQILLRSEEEFAQRKYPPMEQREKSKKSLTECVKSFENAIIFGAGWYGCNLQFLMEHMGLNISAFADNDPKKWGTKIHGISVFPPQKCTELYPNSVYLIAHKRYAEDMKNDLLKLGIPEERIKLYRLQSLTDSVV